MSAQSTGSEPGPVRPEDLEFTLACDVTWAGTMTRP